MTEKHIADGEETFVILNVPPDFCEIDDDVVPFDIVQTLKPEQSDYAKTVFARNEPVLMVSSVIKGVIGNAGAGVTSTVSMGAGYSEVCPNESTIVIEGRNRSTPRFCVDERTPMSTQLVGNNLIGGTLDG